LERVSLTVTDKVTAISLIHRYSASLHHLLIKVDLPTASPIQRVRPRIQLAFKHKGVSSSSTSGVAVKKPHRYGRFLPEDAVDDKASSLSLSSSPTRVPATPFGEVMSTFVSSSWLKLESLDLHMINQRGHCSDDCEYDLWQLPQLRHARLRIAANFQSLPKMICPMLVTLVASLNWSQLECIIEHSPLLQELRVALSGCHSFTQSGYIALQKRIMRLCRDGHTKHLTHLHLSCAIQDDTISESLYTSLVQYSERLTILHLDINEWSPDDAVRIAGRYRGDTLVDLRIRLFMDGEKSQWLANGTYLAATQPNDEHVIFTHLQLLMLPVVTLSLLHHVTLPRCRMLRLYRFQSDVTPIFRRWLSLRHLILPSVDAHRDDKPHELTECPKWPVMHSLDDRHAQLNHLTIFVPSLSMVPLLLLYRESLTCLTLKWRPLLVSFWRYVPWSSLILLDTINIQWRHRHELVDDQYIASDIQTNVIIPSITNIPNLTRVNISGWTNAPDNDAATIIRQAFVTLRPSFRITFTCYIDDDSDDRLFDPN
jgi:hypothetical protein